MKSSSSDTILSEGCGLDISSSGIGILTDRLLSPGDVVKLYIPIGNALLQAFMAELASKIS